MIRTADNRKLLNRRLGNFIRRKLGLYGQRSYAQCGEDVIVRYIFDVLRIDRPTYLDIGAHHPRFLSNTYMLYRQGSRGVNVEPDASLARRFRWWRWRDTTLNAGIGPEPGELEFFIMKSRTLNTFSREEAERNEREGQQIVRCCRVPVLTIESVIADHFEACPNFVSIDVEGLDFEILQSLDLTRFRPEVLCIEVILFASDGRLERNEEIVAYMAERGYMLYADTRVNGIFVDEAAWQKAFAGTR